MITKVDEVENSFGEARKEKKMCEKGAGVSSVGIVAKRKLINPKFLSL